MSKAFTLRPDAGRRGYHHGNLRETLIDAARFLIAERGPQGFTLIEAARLVDVSPAAPYRHFKDRDALVSAVAERGFEAFAERLKEASKLASPTGQDGAIRALEALGAAYLAFSREEPGFYGAMFLAMRAGGPTGTQSFSLLCDAVRLAIGAVGGQAQDVDIVAMQVWALAHGIAILSATGQWPCVPGTPQPGEVLRSGVGAIITSAGASRKET